MGVPLCYSGTVQCLFSFLFVVVVNDHRSQSTLHIMQGREVVQSPRAYWGLVGGWAGGQGESVPSESDFPPFWLPLQRGGGVGGGKYYLLKWLGGSGGAEIVKIKRGVGGGGGRRGGLTHWVYEISSFCRLVVFSGAQYANAFSLHIFFLLVSFWTLAEVSIRF